MGRRQHGAGEPARCSSTRGRLPGRSVSGQSSHVRPRRGGRPAQGDRGRVHAAPSHERRPRPPPPRRPRPPPPSSAACPQVSGIVHGAISPCFVRGLPAGLGDRARRRLPAGRPRSARGCDVPKASIPGPTGRGLAVPGSSGPAGCLAGITMARISARTAPERPTVAESGSSALDSMLRAHHPARNPAPLDLSPSKRWAGDIAGGDAISRHATPNRDQERPLPPAAAGSLRRTPRPPGARRRPLAPSGARHGRPRCVPATTRAPIRGRRRWEPSGSG